MGQYHIICNIDKGEYLDPHKFGQGLKFLEFAPAGDGILYGLAVLLADSQGRGGGDIRSDNPLVGSWAGDRIAITGDYGDKTYIPRDCPNRMDYESSFDYIRDAYNDISDKIISTIRDAEPNSRLAKIDLKQTGWRSARGTS